MAGQEAFLLQGGNPNPNLVGVASIGSGRADDQGNAMGVLGGGSGYQPHHGVLSIVLIAVIGLWALHKFGFRFAVTAGRR